MVLLLVLWIVSTLAALAVADRLTEGRAELLVAGGVVWTTLVVGPMYFLGLANVLTRDTVAASTLILSGAGFVVATEKLKRERIDAFRARLEGLVRLPVDAAKILHRINAIFLVTFVVAIGYFLWQLVSAFYGPCWGDWDALWYHEPIIAWSIQNHGFDPVPLPLNHQVINGYTRLGEITQTWWALFGGRRVVDVSNFVFIPMFMGAMHGIAARFTRDRALPIAWAVALMLLPATMRQLKSTMVDVEAGALVLAAIYFVTHPKPTKARWCLFVLAVTGAVGVKSVVVPTCGVACLVFAVRVFLRRKELGMRWAVGLVLGGATFVVAMMAFTHLRNWIHFKNPLWPVSLEIEKYGIHWPGAFPYLTNKKGAMTGQVDVNLPLPDLLEKLLARPFTVSGGHTWHVDDYGFGPSWVALPAAVIGCFGAPLVWIVGKIKERRAKLSESETTKLAGLAALIAIFALAGFKFSPSVHVPRYTLGPMAAGFAVIVWAMRGRVWQRGSHAVVFVVQVSAIMMTYWVVEPRLWVYTPKEMGELLSMPYPQREASRKHRAPVNEPVALVREREIKKGDVVMFDDSEVWPAMAWNNDFSNQVFWIDAAKDAFAQVEERHAKWVLTRAGTPLSSQLTRAGWRAVGMIENEQWTTAYQRP